MARAFVGGRDFYVGGFNGFHKLFKGHFLDCYLVVFGLYDVC